MVLASSKQDKLEAGQNIDITDNVIKAKGYVYDDTKGSIKQYNIAHDGSTTNFNDNNASGQNSAAFGQQNSVSGESSGVFCGQANKVKGDVSVAAGGYNNEVLGSYSVALGGQLNKVYSNMSFAAGDSNIASGKCSTVTGYKTKATGVAAHAEGYGSSTMYVVAAGDGSHAEGILTETKNAAEHAEGKFNLSHTTSGDNPQSATASTFGSSARTVSSIGVGTSVNNRKNAFEVMQNGDVYVYNVGNYYGTDIKSQNNSIKTLQDIISSVTGITPSTISDVQYDTVNKKLTKTVTGNTTDVVTAAKIVEDGNAITGITMAIVNNAATAAGSNTITYVESVSGGTYIGGTIGGSTVRKTITIPTVTDEKVKQDYINDSNFRPLILGYQSETYELTAVTTNTNIVYANQKFYANPIKGTLYVGNSSTSGTLCINAPTNGNPIISLRRGTTGDTYTDWEIEGSNNGNLSFNETTGGGIYHTRFYIGSTGEVSVPGTLSVNGNASALAFYQTSDARKKNVKRELDIERCYELIDKCSSVVFEWKDDDTHKEEIGMIAQEVREFFPEIVKEDENGFLSLDYARLTVICLRVLKDLINEVKKLKAK